jgi:hypothetical protein
MATIRDSVVRDRLTSVCGFWNRRGPVLGGLVASGSRESDDMAAKVQVVGDDDRGGRDFGGLDGILNIVSIKLSVGGKSFAQNSP